jgi:hypothetical protein
VLMSRVLFFVSRASQERHAVPVLNEQTNEWSDEEVIKRRRIKGKR